MLPLLRRRIVAWPGPARCRITHDMLTCPAGGYGGGSWADEVEETYGKPSRDEFDRAVLLTPS